MKLASIYLQDHEQFGPLYGVAQTYLLFRAQMGVGTGEEGPPQAPPIFWDLAAPLPNNPL